MEIMVAQSYSKNLGAALSRLLILDQIWTGSIQAQGECDAKSL